MNASSTLRGIVAEGFCLVDFFFMVDVIPRSVPNLPEVSRFGNQLSGIRHLPNLNLRGLLVPFWNGGGGGIIRALI